MCVPSMFGRVSSISLGKTDVEGTLIFMNCIYIGNVRVQLPKGPTGDRQEVPKGY